MSKLLVAGERPLTREPRGPFTNPAGKFFRSLMSDARIDPARADFAYPKDLDELHGLILENHNEFVLMTGNYPLQLVHPELRTGQVHGRMMSMGDVLIFPVFHHLAIARQAKQLRSKVLLELMNFKTIAGDRDNWRNHVPFTCAKCRQPGAGFSPSGVVYCFRHAVLAA